jgi:hypothetical protein
VSPFYVDRDVTRAFAVVVHEDYRQHNPAIPDGRDAAVATLAPMFADPDIHATFNGYSSTATTPQSNFTATGTGQPVGVIMDM